jgi:beta-phosphoglucomutase
MEFRGAIFDVDGVLVDSPHDQAWREVLRELMEGDWRDIRDRTAYSPERFTKTVYQQVMAGMPRLAGARAALEYFRVPDSGSRARQYAAAKQNLVSRMIEAGQFVAFADALRFILMVKAAGIPVAAASSSKNAKLFLHQIRLDTFAAEQRLDNPFVHPGLTLLGLFDADISGRDLPRGKPDPMIFLAAAEELSAPPSRCFVVEDAVAGVQAAKAGAMTALGVARLGDEKMLADAGADLVVATLDEVSGAALAGGKLQRRQARERARRLPEEPASAWTFCHEGFDPAREGLRESLCALGNGYFVTRGALPESQVDDVSYPGSYVAGLYNRLQTPIAGRTVEYEDLVNVPNWLPLRFRLAGGPWFDMREAEVLHHRLELDMRRGMLIRTLRWQDSGGRRTAMVQRRVVSMKNPHLAGLETEFTAENWSGTLEVW